MERIQRVTALIERDGDGYVALCPELDIASEGDTIEEARANLHEALALFMETASPEEVPERFHSEVYTGLDVAIGQAPAPFRARGVPHPRQARVRRGPCRGSHIVMQRRAEGTTRTVPVPDHAELRIGTLQSIIWQSELPRAVF